MKYINDVSAKLVQVLMETDNDGNTVAAYNYGNGLISMNRAGSNYYYHYDGLDTVKQITDSSETVAACYTYDGFGNLIASSGSVANPYGFTGESQFSEADDLVFLRARYYAPQIGRFISRDPILTPIQIGRYVGWFLPRLRLIHQPQSLNPYVYVKNNPVNHFDPFGLYGHPICNDNCHKKSLNMGQLKSCLECCMTKSHPDDDECDARAIAVECLVGSLPDATPDTPPGSPRKPGTDITIGFLLLFMLVLATKMILFIISKLFNIIRL